MLVVVFSVSMDRMGGRTVNAQLAVVNDLLDLSLLLQVCQTSPCERSVDLESVDEGGNSD